MGLWRVSLDAIGAALNLGSVMLKDGVGATLAKIAASGSIAEGDNVLGVQAPVLGVTSGARVITDANGTLQQYLRGIASLTAGLATEATLAKMAGGATATCTNVVAAAADTVLLAASATRVGAAVWNDSTAILYLKMGSGASATSCTVKVAADGYYEVPFWYRGALHGYWTSATGTARVTSVAA
jgi:hypothetical protein